MPYCVQCGSQVQNWDQFCGKCGARQAGAGGKRPAPPPREFFSGMHGRTASLLCYIPLVGWIAAIVVLASSRFRQDLQVRFNAFQGLYLFVAWLLVDIVVAPLFVFGVVSGFHFHKVFPAMLHLLIFGTWIYMMIKIAQNEQVHLPILGELAERSVAEQR